MTAYDGLKIYLGDLEIWLLNLKNWHPNNPQFLLRNIDGEIDQGIFEDGQFKVTSSLKNL